MSFAAQVKKELTQIVSKDCCERAELAALVQQCGSLTSGTPGDTANQGLDVATENAAIARRIY
ncbi:MAG: sporulation regulator WhiA, partial [Firmicutes bacterium]|nr:sporulation regulator WhiA [Bacillota bacterium]